jgi:hypothetical protein
LRQNKRDIQRKIKQQLHEDRLKRAEGEKIRILREQEAKKRNMEMQFGAPEDFHAAMRAKYLKTDPNYKPPR